MHIKQLSIKWGSTVVLKVDTGFKVYVASIPHASERLEFGMFYDSIHKTEPLAG